MGLRPIQQMLEAVNIARSDSDVSLFFELMYLGELLLKTVAGGLVAALMDDRDRHRYRQIHRLVRAESLGEWAAVIDEVLAGPAAQFLNPKAHDVQRELTQLVGAGTWQNESVSLLTQCLRKIDPGHEATSARTAGRLSFGLFVALRNKTRGHGATQGDLCSRLCGPLERALRILIDNLTLFSLEWVYLYRNLSGKYRVTALSTTVASFDHLKKTTTSHLPNGVYVYFDEPRRAKSYSCWITRRGCTLAWTTNQASPVGAGGKRRHPRGVENTGLGADKPEAQ